LQQWAAAISKVCWRCLPKILSGSFRARTGRWPARTAGTRDWRICFRGLPNAGNFIPKAPRIRSAGRPGSGRRLRKGKIIATNKDVRGRLGLRHYRSKWQTDEHPGVYRHASTGAGLRDGREHPRQTCKPMHAKRERRGGGGGPQRSVNNVNYFFLWRALPHLKCYLS
jgi:hypothetical protein